MNRQKKINNANDLLNSNSQFQQMKKDFKEVKELKITMNKMI